MREACLAIALNLFTHGLGVVETLGSACLNFLVDRGPIGMRECRHRLAGFDERVQKTVDIPEDHDVGIDPDGELVVGQQPVGMRLHVARHTPRVDIEGRYRFHLPHTAAGPGRIAEQKKIEAGVDDVGQFDGIVVTDDGRVDRNLVAPRRRRGAARCVNCDMASVKDRSRARRRATASLSLRSSITLSRGDCAGMYCHCLAASVHSPASNAASALASTSALGDAFASQSFLRPSNRRSHVDRFGRERCC